MRERKEAHVKGEDSKRRRVMRRKTRLPENRLQTPPPPPAHSSPANLLTHECLTTNLFRYAHGNQPYEQNAQHADDQ